MADRYHLLAVDEVPPLAVVGGSLQWRPLRRTLGVRAFGINAYTAATAGDDVVEDHTEEGLGHEEIYIVLAGRATFTVDGDTLDVPAGSLVYLPDPALRRHAVAAEPNTTVLAVGGKPGAAFQPSAWEHYFAAGAAQEEGDLDRAMELVQRGLEEHPGNVVLLFNAACYQALAGHGDEAIEFLRQAYEADPDGVREFAGDPDLNSIRDRPDWPL
ncbi:MAG TPA: tetratricopeptide repeat protein [Gaiellales bacterium]|nr:tetratricopeptide repeat protein [Gaiellales bacterium]